MKNKNMSELAESAGEAIDRQILDVLKQGTSLSYVGWPQKMRNKRVPRYFSIWIPSIEKHYDSEDYDFEGWLVSFWKKDLFQIGWKWVKVPVMRRFKSPRYVKWKRYNQLYRLPIQK